MRTRVWGSFATTKKVFPGDFEKLMTLKLPRVLLSFSRENDRKRNPRSRNDYTHCRVPYTVYDCSEMSLWEYKLETWDDDRHYARPPIYDHHSMSIWRIIIIHFAHAKPCVMLLYYSMDDYACENPLRSNRTKR